MKLHLPVCLFRSLVLLSGLLTAQAAVRHEQVSDLTYVDFATNCGRFVTGSTNALLDHIRQRDGGVQIHYRDGLLPFTLPHGMIDFDSVVDGGHITCVGPNYVVTVAHNASRLYPVFSGNEVGKSHAPRYVTIEEYGAKNRFVNHIFHGAMNDYKLSRLSKVVTDAPIAPMTGGANAQVKGELLYRVGGGLQQRRGADEKNYDESIQDTYLVGGIAKLADWVTSHDDKNVQLGMVIGTDSWAVKGVSDSSPLPFGSTQGDSGSPYFVWDAADGQFKFLMAHRGSTSGNRQTQGCEALEWSRRVMAENSFCVDMGKVKGEVVIAGAKSEPGKGDAADEVNGVRFTAAPARGYLRDDSGNLYDKNWNAAFNAVESGQRTWKSLAPLRNQDAWYAYGEEFLNATDSVVVVDKEAKTAGGLTYSRLFLTQNLVFEAGKDGAAYTLRVDEDTDLGVGYLHFASMGYKGVEFSVVAAGKQQLDSAGLVVDAGATLNLKLCNEDAAATREWRKVGSGTLRICGKGKNEVLLNVGGPGSTLLDQQDGYAAYNVLVNMGSTVSIRNTEQIYRDLTFGHGGGALDLMGNKMDWYLTQGEKREGFTIRALTEEAVITNTASHAELIFREPGNHTFAGSFRDTKGASLGITYAAGKTWVLNSIRTQLTHPDSHFTVQSGTVKLSGTLTRHGVGTVHTRDSASSLVRKDDWHYADAAMNVRVQKGAVFELESHARLTGTVTVEPGGRYVMHPGVHAEKEYIEGGEHRESTSGIADFYGHKGGVKLAAGATLQLQPGSKAQLCSLELASGSRVQSAGASLAVEKLTLAVDSAPGCNVKIPAHLRLRGADGKSMRTGLSSAVELRPETVQGGLQLTCRELTLDFRGMKKKFRGMVRVRLGKEVKFEKPESMRINAITARGIIPGYYHPAEPGALYFKLP